MTIKNWFATVSVVVPTPEIALDIDVLVLSPQNLAEKCSSCGLLFSSVNHATDMVHVVRIVALASYSSTPFVYKTNVSFRNALAFHCKPKVALAVKVW